jgi:hypothetical protein
MGDLDKGMSSEIGLAPDLNPCPAKDCGDRPESVESLETRVLKIFTYKR